MANEEHLKIIQQGVEDWNAWRAENLDITPDLSMANLSSADPQWGSKLFPIRLVDFTAIEKWECFDADTKKDLAIEVREFYVPDFSNWKDHDVFEAEFAKLLRDLRAEAYGV